MLNICCYVTENNKNYDAVGSLSPTALPGSGALAQNLDWVASVEMVETWLDQCVGRHWCEWCWNMWTLEQHKVCGVSFRWEPAVSLFLLRFGTGIEEDL